MTYVESNLSPDEQIIYIWEIHGFYNVAFVFQAIIGIFIMFLFASSSFPDSPLRVISFFWLAIILNSCYKILFNLTTEIAVTTKRVIYKTWIIARNVFELQLSKVESATLDQTIFQRMIGAWFLRVSWTGWHSRPIEFLAKPTDMRTVIYEQIEKISNPK